MSFLDQMTCSRKLLKGGPDKSFVTQEELCIVARYLLVLWGGLSALLSMWTWLEFILDNTARLDWLLLIFFLQLHVFQDGVCPYRSKQVIWMNPWNNWNKPIHWNDWIMYLVNFRLIRSFAICGGSPLQTSLEESAKSNRPITIAPSL